MALRRKTSLTRVADSESERSTRDPLNAPRQKSPRNLKLTKKDSATQPPVAPEIIDPVLAGFLELPCETLAPLPVQENTQEQTTARVESALEKLGDLEAAVIAALFPTDGSTPSSFEEIAKKLGLTMSEVQSLADNGLRGLRGTKTRTPRISTVWN